MTISDYQYVQLCQRIKALELETKTIKAKVERIRIKNIQAHIVKQIMSLLKENKICLAVPSDPPTTTKNLYSSINRIEK